MTHSSMANKSDLLSTARFFVDVDFSLKVGEGGRLEHDDSSLMTSSLMTSSVGITLDWVDGNSVVISFSTSTIIDLLSPGVAIETGRDGMAF